MNSITVTYNILFNNIIIFHRGLRGRRKEHFTICQQTSVGLDFAYTCTFCQSLSPAKIIHYSYHHPSPITNHPIISSIPSHGDPPFPSHHIAPHYPGAHIYIRCCPIHYSIGKQHEEGSISASKSVGQCRANGTL